MEVGFKKEPAAFNNLEVDKEVSSHHLETSKLANNMFVQQETSAKVFRALMGGGHIINQI